MLKYLIICAHPDDETLGLGGTIKILNKKKADISCLVFTEGESAREKSLRRIKDRENQSKKASKILGINQIQFLREKLQKEVRSYIEIDDKIKALSKATKDYKKSKDNLSQSILETMKKFEINDMNIKSGKLTYNEKTTKNPLNKKNLLNGLTLYFKEDVWR